MHIHRFLSNRQTWAMLCAIAASLLLAPIGAARADLGYWSAALVGTWRHPSNGDRYRFNANATYTFYAGAAKRKLGVVSHSGFWKLYVPDPKEVGYSQEGPVGLRLNTKSRVVLQGGKRRTLRSSRTFRLLIDTVENDGHRDENLYRIDGLRWRRVR